MGKAFFLVLTFLAVAAVAFMGGFWYKENSANKTNSTPTPTTTTQNTSTPTGQTTSTDQYSGWLTYTNNTIGYKLKYPSGWTVKEINTTSEATNTNVKYITLTTPDKKYFLAFGLKKKTDTFTTSDRTGIGAGDFTKKGKITILDTKVDIEQLIYKNKIKEFFFPQATTTTTDGNYKFTVSFSPDSSVNYDTLDMTNLTEETTAEKILQSVELL